MFFLTKLRQLINRPSEDETQEWMIPYCTLMMALMILFAALYTISAGSPLSYESALASLGLDQEGSTKEIALAKDLKTFTEGVHTEGLAEVVVTSREIRLKLSAPVVFESGSAEIKPDIMPLLLRLFDHIKDMDNLIVVEGHTDDVPIHTARYSSNWELSAGRAFSIINFYIARGIRPKRLVAHGFGEYKPVMSNRSELGQAVNRRIEIAIMREGRN